MSPSSDNEVIHVAQQWLSPEVPLSVHLVTGSRYAVLVDTGVAGMWPGIESLITRTLPDPHKLRLVVNTHAHHDHMGCNTSVAQLTGAMIAGSGAFSHWYTDLERHYTEFALSHIELVPDDPAVHLSILADIDGDRPLDLHLEEGFMMDLGGGVELETLAFPGHMSVEFGFFEHCTRTLILGDSLVGSEWSFLHGYGDVVVYRATLAKMLRIVEEYDVATLRAAHYPVYSRDEAIEAIERVERSVDVTEQAVRQVAATRKHFTLGDAWHDVSAKLHKVEDFRGLRVVEAHLQALVDLDVIAKTQDQTYSWFGDAVPV